VPTCPSCGHQNPPGARFCNRCATPLTAVTAVPEQLKTITVLFADVTGSTELGERLDPEALWLAGDRAGAIRQAERAASFYRRKGATVPLDRARRLAEVIESGGEASAWRRGR
jgi:Double zinc ribbon